MGKALKSLTLGGILGFIVGLLFAPRKGEETRQKVKEVVEKGKEKLKEIREEFSKGTEE